MTKLKAEQHCALPSVMVISNLKLEFRACIQDGQRMHIRNTDVGPINQLNRKCKTHLDIGS